MRKLEYIETSGGQYIDTGYIVKPNTSLVMRCNVQAQYQFPAPFGVRASSGNQAFCYFARDNGASMAVISFGSGELRLSQPLAVYNNDIEITFTNSTFTIKNVTTDELLVNRQFTQMGALSQTLSLYLFKIKFFNLCKKLFHNFGILKFIFIFVSILRYYVSMVASG